VNLHELAIGAARRHPDRIAVVGSDRTLRYAELDRQATGLAHRLRRAGVGRGDRVLLWGEKTPDMVAATQAVLRLGAAYVPADERNPAHRVAVIAQDCGAAAVCTTGGRLAELRALLGPDAAVLDLAEPAPPGAIPPVDTEVGPDDLAYILYTSGSTGTPKGVCISHRNAKAFIDWAVELLRPEPTDRVANHAPLTFDLSVLDLYLSFAAGAAVVLVPEELAYAPAQLVDFLHQREISIWYSVPSALTLMIRDGGLLDQPAPSALRAVLFAGEPFPITRVRQLYRWTSARLLNLYGPTETNVCTYHEVTAADLAREQPVPIGAACSGDTVWAQADDGTVAGPGMEGELVVSGPTVMLGYWGRPPQSGPYRTGDVVRVLADGRYDYVGRRDQLVKVRGHRIELAEVEAALAGHPDVADAAVTVVGSGETARLAGFVVAVTGRTPGVLSVRRHLAEQLPRYMIVSELTVVADLPRTVHGKVDRALLAALAVGAAGSAPAASPGTDPRPRPTAYRAGEPAAVLDMGRS
jgi:amino acid adenylation domain-containing protein